MRQALVVLESMEMGNIHRGIYNALVELGLPCYPLDLPRDSSAVEGENAELVAERSRGDDIGIVLLIGPNDHLAESALEPARMSGKEVISIQIDDPWAISHSQVRLTAFYDEVLTNDPRSVLQYQALGVQRCETLPFGFDPLVFHPPLTQRKLAYLTLFLGSVFPPRYMKLQQLHAAGVSVTCLGPGPPPLWVQNRRVPSWALPKLFQSARICLNLADQPDGRCGMKIRPFEITASGGGCLLSERWPGCEEFFTDGEDAVFFRTVPELIEGARWLLREPSRCRVHSKAACERAHREHTWAHRLQPHVERWKGELA